MANLHTKNDTIVWLVESTAWPNEHASGLQLWTSRSSKSGCDITVTMTPCLHLRYLLITILLLLFGVSGLESWGREGEGRGGERNE